jgi:hypothetical protein
MEESFGTSSHLLKKTRILSDEENDYFKGFIPGQVILASFLAGKREREELQFIRYAPLIGK